MGRRPSGLLLACVLVALVSSTRSRPLGGEFGDSLHPVADGQAGLATHPDAMFAALKGNVTATYFTNTEMASFLHLMAGQCSHMMSLFSIGKSVDGMDILALDISYTSGLRFALCLLQGMRALLCLSRS